MKTLVLLSGGVDSTLCLALALTDGDPVEAMSVNYGQRHNREIIAAMNIANHYGVPHGIMKVDPALFVGSALTGGQDIPDGHAEAPDATYVPARNTVLLAMAAARAEAIGARRIVIGANKDDAAGYPDCRPGYIHAFRDVLTQGTISHVWIHTPLIGLTKREVIRSAKAMAVPLHLTWSCYRGDNLPCGTCGACVSLQEAECLT